MVGFVGGGLGLLMTIEIVKNRRTKEKYPGGFQGDFAKRFTEIVRGHGLAIRAGDSIVLSPPLTIDKNVTDSIIDILDVSLSEIEAGVPSGRVGRGKGRPGPGANEKRGRVTRPLCVSAETRGLVAPAAGPLAGRSTSGSTPDDRRAVGTAPWSLSRTRRLPRGAFPAAAGRSQRTSSSWSPARSPTFHAALGIVDVALGRVIRLVVSREGEVPTAVLAGESPVLVAHGDLLSFHSCLESGHQS